MAKLTYSVYVTGRLYGRRARRLRLGRSRRRRVALLHQRDFAVIRHLFVRTEDVRNGVSGDRARFALNRVRARICEGVAGGGEDRLLKDPRRAAQRADEDRACIRSWRSPGSSRPTRAYITVDGPALAAQAIRANLVDAFHMK
jgi:hypothetical protein